MSKTPVELTNAINDLSNDIAALRDSTRTANKAEYNLEKEREKFSTSLYAYLTKNKILSKYEWEIIDSNTKKNGWSAVQIRIKNKKLAHTLAKITEDTDNPIDMNGTELFIDEKYVYLTVKGLPTVFNQTFDALGINLTEIITRTIAKQAKTWNNLGKSATEDPIVQKIPMIEAKPTETDLLSKEEVETIKKEARTP